MNMALCSHCGDAIADDESPDRCPDCGRDVCHNCAGGGGDCLDGEIGPDDEVSEELRPDVDNGGGWCPRDALTAVAVDGLVNPSTPAAQAAPGRSAVEILTQ